MSIFLPEDDGLKPAAFTSVTPPLQPQPAEPPALPSHLADVMAQLQAAARPQTQPQQPQSSQAPSLLPPPQVSFITQDNATRLTLTKAYKIAAKSPASNPVLILGPSGTGKELLAQVIHGGLPYPFLLCNIASLPETLLQSTLFGHTKGSFTGAVTEFHGLFRSAGHGTVFLDEIGDMPLSQQPALLRVLENRQVTPVGSTLSYPIHCRIIAATNRDHRDPQYIRSDLAARFMHVLQLTPLSARPDDTELIANHYGCKGWRDIPADELAVDNVRAIKRKAADEMLYS